MRVACDHRVFERMQRGHSRELKCNVWWCNGCHWSPAGRRGQAFRTSTLDQEWASCLPLADVKCCCAVWRFLHFFWLGCMHAHLCTDACEACAHLPRPFPRRHDVSSSVMTAQRCARSTASHKAPTIKLPQESQKIICPALLPGWTTQLLSGIYAEHSHLAHPSLGLV